MSEWSQFEKYTHDALTHLYDLPYLREHPLTRWVGPIAGSDEPGRVLRRMILDAIQDTKPPPDSPHDTAAAARYQFLYLRYVKGRSMDEIARQLSLGERQLYRRQRDALHTVMVTLARKLRVPWPNEDAPQAVARLVKPPSVGDETIASDVDRIGTAPATTPIDLRLVVQGVLSTVARLTQDDRRTVVLKTGPGLLLVAADRVAVRQAMLGLLMFALDASREGEILLTVNRSGPRVDLVVRLRTEAGLAGPTSTGGDSNLVVCRRLMELQGGEVSWRMEGSDLVIVSSLPVASPQSVLIVDDNADTRRTFRRYLEAHAHRVLTASTGEEAVRVVAEERPDAVVLDVMLPSVDGYEALQSLRSDPVTANVPVIVCTVLQQRDLALSLGATEFLAKPVTQGDLLAALDRCWSR